MGGVVEAMDTERERETRSKNLYPVVHNALEKISNYPSVTPIRRVKKNKEGKPTGNKEGKPTNKTTTKTKTKKQKQKNKKTKTEFSTAASQHTTTMKTSTRLAMTCGNRWHVPACMCVL